MSMTLKDRLDAWARTPAEAKLAAALVAAVAKGEGDVWWISGTPVWKPNIPLCVSQWGDYVTDGNGAQIDIVKDP